ncbi:MAG: tetratricopeptide repeat protein [Candidatus Thorarchaeota archaeon]
MYGLLGVIIIIGIISVALPIIFPSLLAGSITFFLALKPEDHVGWIFYAELLVKQSQYLEAIDAYRTAAKLRPDISEIWIKLGNLLAKLGQFDEADRAFQIGLDSGIF